VSDHSIDFCFSLPLHLGEHLSGGRDRLGTSQEQTEVGTHSHHEEKGFNGHYRLLGQLSVSVANTWNSDLTVSVPPE
jgi:hypothetical protein